MSSVILLQTDPRVAERLRQVLAAVADLRVVASVSSIAQVRDLLSQGAPDLLISDLRLRDGPLTSLLADLRDSSGHEQRPRVMAAAISFSDRRLMEALRRGCDGYFVKDCSAESLLLAVKQVLAGESAMAPEIARKVRSHFCSSAWDNTDFVAETQNPLRLTDHERLILDLIDEGHAVQEIAKGMRISTHDVGLRIRAIYRKMQLDLSAETLSLMAA
jgi:DNA-binding NarL/FixJ family response regulator